MTPTDELWIDMAQFDTETADGLWDGQLPADAPAWCSDVASLIGTARGPATGDELAAEDDIVSRMAEAILAAAAGDAPSDEELFLDFPRLGPSDDGLELAFVTAGAPTSGEVVAVGSDVADVDEPDGPDAEAPVDGTKVNGTKPRLTVVPLAPAQDEAAEERVAALAPRPFAGGRRRPAGKRSGGPRHLAPRDGDGTGGLRLLRRVVAVKAVATTTAVAIGITAAAAATGVVVTVVDPPKWPGSSNGEDAQSTTLLPPAMTIDLGEPEEAGRAGRHPRSSPVRQLTCLLDFGCPDPANVLGPETAEVLAELKQDGADEYGRRVVTTTTTRSRPTSTAATPEPITRDAGGGEPTTTSSVPVEVTTTTSSPVEATTTTSSPVEATTTTSAPDPSTTTSTTDTTVQPGPSTLSSSEG